MDRQPPDEKHQNQTLSDLQHKYQETLDDLTATRNMLQLVMDNIPQFIFWKDRNSTYLGCNQNFAEAGGLSSPEEIVGKSDFDLPWKPEESEFFRECDRRVMEQDQPQYRIIEPQLRADGKEVWLETNKVPLHDQDAEVIGILGTYEDITERMEAKQELERHRDHLEQLVEQRMAEQRKLEDRMRQTQKLESLGILAGGVAHDFSNLLVGVMGYVDLALTQIPTGTKAADCLKKAMHHSQRAADLCEQMLAYSGKGQFMTGEFDLNALVNELRSLVIASIPKRVELCCEVASTPTLCQGDVTQIRQILLNLALNGSEAIGKRSGKLTLRTGSVHCDSARLEHSLLPEPLPPGDYHFIEVADSGCGMDEKTLRKIFDPFFTTKFTGRGLGLAAVLGIVRGHEGTIEVESTVGSGTVFRVLLPTAKSKEEKEEAPVERQAPPQSTKGTVLVVDDEEAILQIAEFALEAAGFNVFRAHDGIQALEVFESRRAEIDCVLLDLTMPRMDGIETYRRLRRLEPQLPILLSSAYSEETSAQEGLGTHKPSGFLRKPYRARDLLHKVADVLSVA